MYKRGWRTLEANHSASHSQQNLTSKHHQWIFSHPSSLSLPPLPSLSPRRRRRSHQLPSMLTAEAIKEAIPALSRRGYSSSTWCMTILMTGKRILASTVFFHPSHIAAHMFPSTTSHSHPYFFALRVLSAPLSWAGLLYYTPFSFLWLWFIEVNLVLLPSADVSTYLALR